MNKCEHVLGSHGSLYCLEIIIIWRSFQSLSPPLLPPLYPPLLSSGPPRRSLPAGRSLRGSSVSPRSDHSLLHPPSSLTCPQAPPDAVSQLVEAFRGSAVAARDQTAIGELQMGAAMQGGGGGAHGAHGAHGRRGGGELRGLQKYEAGYLIQVWGRARGGGSGLAVQPGPDKTAIYSDPSLPPTPFTQVYALAGRLARHATRHPLLIGLNLVASGAMALGIGAIYWDTGRDTGGIQVGGGGGGGVMVLGIGAIYWDTGRDTGGIQVGGGGGGGVMVLGIGAIYWDTGRDTGGIQVGGEGGGRRGGEGGRLGVD